MRASVLLTALLSVTVASQAEAQGQVVGPGGTVVAGSGSNWIPWTQAGGQAQVTMDKGQFGWGDVGDGSLRLYVTGQQGANGEYPDWAFWYRYAGGTAENSMATLQNGGSFGLLEKMSELSFDWFRVGLPGWDAPCPQGETQPIAPCDWSYKTPVIRLQIVETWEGIPIQTELVWEGYFNQGILGGTTPVDDWVTSTNLHEGNFWYVRPDLGGDPLYSIIGSSNCGLGTMTFWEGTAQASSLDRLFGQDGCLFGSNAQVIGIALGVGSQWPLEYLAYADNVRMGFDGQRVLDTNFDYVVPEPGTYALVALGLLALAGARKRKKVRSN